MTLEVELPPCADEEGVAADDEIVADDEETVAADEDAAAADEDTLADDEEAVADDDEAAELEKTEAPALLEDPVVLDEEPVKALELATTRLEEGWWLDDGAALEDVVPPPLLEDVLLCGVDAMQAVNEATSGRTSPATVVMRALCGPATVARNLAGVGPLRGAHPAHATAVPSRKPLHRLHTVARPQQCPALNCGRTAGKPCAAVGPARSPPSDDVRADQSATGWERGRYPLTVVPSRGAAP